MVEAARDAYGMSWFSLVSRIAASVSKHRSQAPLEPNTFFPRLATLAGRSDNPGVRQRCASMSPNSGAPRFWGIGVLSQGRKATPWSVAPHPPPPTPLPLPKTPPAFRRCLLLPDDPLMPSLFPTAILH